MNHHRHQLRVPRARQRAGRGAIDLTQRLVTAPSYPYSEAPPPRAR